MRSVVAHRSIEKYLQKCGSERKFSFGLVIGQATLQNKDYIVHLAKNSDCNEGEHETEIPVVEGENSQSQLSVINTIEEIDSTALSHQVMSLIRMIPGSFFVLGVFFVDDSDIYANTVVTDKLMLLIDDVNRNLKKNRHMTYGNTKVLEFQKLIMFYNSAERTVDCKYYDPSDSNRESFIPAECVFIDKCLEWTLFESNYELDEVFPIVERDKKLNIEKHFNFTLDSIDIYIKGCKLFVQDEPVEENTILDSYLKKNQNKYEKCKAIPVSILLTTMPTEDPIFIEQYHGLIRYSGIIASRVWVHSKITFKEIYDFIRADIMRSLASRIQIYSDGLIDPNASDDAFVVNEPPRRVFFDKPDGNGIQFCDYIFRGESSSVVTAQAKYILDLDIQPDNVDDGVEGFPEDEHISINKLPSSFSRTTKYNIREYGQVMYMAGLATAILILLVSIILHYVFL